MSKLSILGVAVLALLFCLAMFLFSSQKPFGLDKERDKALMHSEEKLRAYERELSIAKQKIEELEVGKRSIDPMVEVIE